MAPPREAELPSNNALLISMDDAKSLPNAPPLALPSSPLRSTLLLINLELLLDTEPNRKNTAPPVPAPTTRLFSKVDPFNSRSTPSAIIAAPPDVDGRPSLDSYKPFLKVTLLNDTSARLPVAPRGSLILIKRKASSSDALSIVPLVMVKLFPLGSVSTTNSELRTIVLPPRSITSSSEFPTVVETAASSSASLATLKVAADAIPTDPNKMSKPIDIRRFNRMADERVMAENREYMGILLTVSLPREYTDTPCSSKTGYIAEIAK